MAKVISYISGHKTLLLIAIGFLLVFYLILGFNILNLTNQEIDLTLRIVVILWFFYVGSIFFIYLLASIPIIPLLHSIVSDDQFSDQTSYRKRNSITRGQKAFIYTFYFIIVSTIVLFLVFRFRSGSISINDLNRIVYGKLTLLQIIEQRISDWALLPLFKFESETYNLISMVTECLIVLSCSLVLTIVTIKSDKLRRSVFQFNFGLVLGFVLIFITAAVGEGILKFAG